MLLSLTTIVVSSSSEVASVVDDELAASSAKYSSLPLDCWAVDSLKVTGEMVDVETTVTTVVVVIVALVSSGWIVSSSV